MNIQFNVPPDILTKFMDFIVQLSSNFFATIFAGFLLYWFLEKKIRDSLKKDEINRLLKNLAGDLAYNYVRAQKAIENRDEYSSSDRFTLSQYRTEELLNFYYQKPFSEEAKFPYAKLRGIIAKLEDNNTLAQLVFQISDSKAIIDNKVQWVANAEKIMAAIAEFLHEIQPFYDERGIVLGKYS